MSNGGKGSAMNRLGHAIADMFAPVHSTGGFCRFSGFSKTTAKTTTKTV
ncbi:hypothetical protein LXM94_20700 [Rhizobium sp. TRM95111]|nr:hypothetical protein [Rhizobium alarense]MCF3642395.1 hypothetical protein [Rhizobium alarense]